MTQTLLDKPGAPRRFTAEELIYAVMDAHLSGRVYAKGGEKRSPAAEYVHMIDGATRAVLQLRRDKRKLRSSRRG